MRQSPRVAFSVQSAFGRCKFCYLAMSALSRAARAALQPLPQHRGDLLVVRLTLSVCFSGSRAVALAAAAA